MKLLIDGDVITYRAGFAVEKTHYLVTLPDDNKTPYVYSVEGTAKEAHACLTGYPDAQIWTRREFQPVENALQITKTIIENICERLNSTDYTIFLSGKDNFRENVAVTKPYKGNRDDSPRPKWYKAIREYLIQHHGAKVIDGMEADDALGIAQDRNSCIVSNDKDLDQIPGWHFNFTLPDAKPYEVTPKMGMWKFYEQVLTGDATDNVPGLPGVGKVKAEILLEGAQSPKQLAELAVAAYNKAGCDKAYLDEQATLVWIQRQGQIDHPLWKHLDAVH